MSERPKRKGQVSPPGDTPPPTSTDPERATQPPWRWSQITHLRSRVGGLRPYREDLVKTTDLAFSHSQPSGPTGPGWSRSQRIKSEVMGKVSGRVIFPEGGTWCDGIEDRAEHAALLRLEVLVFVDRSSISFPHLPLVEAILRKDRSSARV